MSFPHNPTLTGFCSLLAALVIFSAPPALADTATKEKPAAKEKAADQDATNEATEEKADPTDDAKKDDKQDKAAEAAKEKKAKKVAKVRLAQFTIDTTLPETPGGSGPFAELKTDLRTLLDRIERAAEDDDIDGMVLKLEGAGLGRGTVNELREAVKRFRQSDKKAYAQLSMAMPADYLVALSCDEIIMPESGTLLLPGISIEAMFYKGLLDKIGVKADMLHMGEAKGAAEPFTRDNFSDSVKANLSAMIDDMYEQMVEAVSFDRPITRAEAEKAIDRGLITAAKAKQMGLIDRVAYNSELRDSLAETYNTDNLVYVQNYGKQKVDTDFSGPTGILKLIKMMSGSSSSSKSSGKKIAVVYAVGAIMTGESETDLFGESSTMGSTTIIEALREAADDDDVAAIVLRINSPGGSALASDLMWSKIQEIEKPIVASMGDVAASGGYYIAMGTDKILAEPTTITGSIGVVGGKIALGGLYDKIGVSIDTISRGTNAGVFSVTNKFTDSEREVIRDMMEDTYEQFTTKAAEGRDMPVEQLKKLAGGKVYSGRQAKANGLVDQLGTLHDAVQEAKKLAGIDADKDVKIKTLPEAPDLFESLFGGSEAEKEVEVKVDLGDHFGFGPLPDQLKHILARAKTFERVLQEPVIMMMPFHLEIK